MFCGFRLEESILSAVGTFGFGVEVGKVDVEDAKFVFKDEAKIGDKGTGFVMTTSEVRDEITSAQEKVFQLEEA